MAARIGNIAFDCVDVLSTARFWSTVLGRPLDEGSSADFATIGGADSERAEPAWYFNKVSETKRAKNRIHVDLVDPDPSAVDKLVTLGVAPVKKVVAKKTAAQTKKTVAKATAPTIDPQAVRVWAANRNIEVSARGRISADVVTRYLKAHPSTR